MPNAQILARAKMNTVLEMIRFKRGDGLAMWQDKQILGCQKG